MVDGSEWGLRIVIVGGAVKEGKGLRIVIVGGAVKEGEGDNVTVDGKNFGKEVGGVDE